VIFVCVVVLLCVFVFVFCTHHSPLTTHHSPLTTLWILGSPNYNIGEWTRFKNIISTVANVKLLLEWNKSGSGGGECWSAVKLLFSVVAHSFWLVNIYI
jgi:hypothetical protein